MNRGSRFNILAAACALACAAPALSQERLMQAPGPPDIRAVAIDLSYYERGREGWVRAGGPKIGGMVAVRCTYEYTPGADAASWSVAFLDGDTVLDRAIGTGLLEPRSRSTSRTWYGRILEAGSAQLACVADVDNELAESNEGNNRMTRALSTPAARATTARTDPGAAPRRRFGIVTPREAALARGEAPKLDLGFVAAAGIKRAGDPRAVRAMPSVSTAAIGESLAVNCGYRVHMDAPNGETHRVSPWQIAIERDGEALRNAAGRTDLVSVRGATTTTDFVERFMPAQAGTYRFRCRLDPGGAIAETDETNNVAEFTVNVGTAAARKAPPAKPAKPPVRGQPLLAFAATKPGTLELVMGAKETVVYKGQLKVRLKWQSPDAAAYDWRWQVSLWPFPGDPGVPPPALLRDGSVPKNAESVFWIDLASFPPLGKTAKATSRQLPPSKSPAVRTKKSAIGNTPAEGTSRKATMTKLAPALAAGNTPEVVDAPMDFHMRIVPVKAGKPAGAPSNAVIAQYQPGPDPSAVAASKAITAESLKKQKLAEMNEQATVHKIDVLSFERPVFAHPARYGCVVVVKNPYYQKLGHPLMTYQPGDEYCPKKDPKYQEKSTGEWIMEGLEGYAHAWNGISWFYDKAKDTVASLFAEVIVPCSLLKELDEDAMSTCQDIAKEVAGTAITVGLTAAGVPPTIPDLKGMSELAKGEAVEAAVDYTCDLIESEGGHCTPEMREGLAAAYSKGIDQLQKDLKQQAQEPDCGNAEEAGEHGRLPLPCFSQFPGAEVKPAPGAVETSPAVKIRITRTKPDPKFATDCSVKANLVVRNDIPDYGKTEAALWPAAHAKIPSISGLGGSATVTLNFGPRQPWHPLGKQGATAEWYQLLSGGTGTLTVYGSGTAQAQPPIPPGKVSVDCAVGPGPKTITIPKSFSDKTFPWKMN